MIADTLETREPETPNASDAQQIHLTLLFDYNNGDPNWTWSGTSLINDTVTVNQATAEFTISLDPASTSGASLTRQIRWVQPTVGHIGQPPAIRPVVLKNGKLYFVDNNPQGGLTWNFQVWVGYQGQGYLSSEPTIINADI